MLEFEGTVQLKEFQLLSHQSLIASKVEIYARGPNSDFERLGKFSLDSNASTNFKTREFKSVRVECACSAIRLSFSANHPNELNPYNKVGVVALAFYSTQEKSAPLASPASPVPVPALDPTTAALLEQLEQQKRMAIADEDYGKAGAIKDRIGRVRELATQLK